MQNDILRSVESRQNQIKTGRSTSMSHTVVQFTPHKLFPPRLKIKSESVNPKVWNFKRKEEFSYNPNAGKQKEDVTNSDKKTSAPGPGSYEIATKTKLPLGLISKEPIHKFTSNIDNIGPGPGFYNITSVWRGRQTKPTFNSTKLRQLFQEINQPTPGPGDYQKKIGNNPVVSKYRSSSMCTISKSQKNNFPKQQTPGPGTYLNRKHQKPKKNSYKFLHRYMV